MNSLLGGLVSTFYTNNQNTGRAQQQTAASSSSFSSSGSPSEQVFATAIRRNSLEEREKVSLTPEKFAIFREKVSDLNQDFQNIRWGFNALFFAIAPKDFEFLVYLVERSSLQIDSRNKAGETPLICAVAVGSVKVVQCFLDYQANPNIETKLGDTPLKRSIRWKNSPIFQLLIEYGADVHAVDKIRGETSLMQAAEIKDRERVKELVAKNCDVNVVDSYGDTCITRCIIKYDYDLLQYFVDIGATIRSEDRAFALKRKMIIPLSTVEKEIVKKEVVHFKKLIEMEQSKKDGPLKCNRKKLNQYQWQLLKWEEKQDNSVWVHSKKSLKK